MKVDKSVTCEMQYILDKCKYEEIETFERIKKIIFKCTTNIYSINITNIIINSTLSFNKIFLIHKYVWRVL
jgi:hypothetical protein